MKTTLIICIFAFAFIGFYQSSATEINAVKIFADSVKTDPVCKMKVKRPANYTSTYQNNEYWFCAKGCKLKFDKNPASFTKTKTVNQQ